MLTPHISPNFTLLRVPDPERTAGSMPVWRGDESFQISTESKAYALNMAENPQATPAAKPDDAFGFGDILDMINPLQNLPIVGSLYRAVTGDTIKPASQVVGGTLFGGMVGFGIGMVNVIAQAETGKDAPEAMMGFLGGDAPHSVQPHIEIASRKPQYNT
jgi:hypothetical protein